jgi:nucleoid DNA-binding protein
MDKPISLSVKDFLIRKMAVKMMLSEQLIETVINHQFQTTLEALTVPGVDSVEVSGFGKFLFNRKKAFKKMEIFHKKKEKFEEQLKDNTLTETKRKTIESMLRATLYDIEVLKPKLEIYEHQADLRGMEEQAGSTISSEGTDRNYSREEDGDLREMHLSLGGSEKEV